MSTTGPFENWEKKIPRHPLVDRDAYLLELCRGRMVAHLGACDAPMSREKAQVGELLHQKMQGLCAVLTGYDNDQGAIKLLASEFGLKDIVYRDLSEPFVADEASANLVICADIIEHVNNVGNLLESCRRLLVPGGELVLTTINALSVKQAVRSLMGREPVHPDHVAYYSYATLGRLIGRFGFEMTHCRFFPYVTVSRLAGIAFGALYSMAPQSADGIIVVARLAADE